VGLVLVLSVNLLPVGMPPYLLASMLVGGQVAFAVGGVNQSSQCCKMTRAAKNMPCMLSINVSKTLYSQQYKGYIR